MPSLFTTVLFFDKHFSLIRFKLGRGKLGSFILLCFSNASLFRFHWHYLLLSSNVSTVFMISTRFDCLQRGQLVNKITSTAFYKSINGGSVIYMYIYFIDNDITAFWCCFGRYRQYYHS